MGTGLPPRTRERVEKVGKLAGGISARDAARAFIRSRSGAEVGSEDRARADEFEATIEAMFLMAAVDGDVADDEIAQLAASIQAIAETETEHVGPKGLRPIIDLEGALAELNARLAKAGWKARLDDVARRLRTPEARTFAFRLAAGVAFVDDNVAHAEAAAIDAFAAALSLPKDVSQEILVEVHEMLFAD